MHLHERYGPEILLVGPNGTKMRDKRVVVRRYSGPELITVIEEDVPTPKAREVRVKVRAAGVSLPDVLAREGVHPETPPFPTRRAGISWEPSINSARA